jgi:GNAT superfamily N-acetyltransferase
MKAELVQSPSEADLELVEQGLTRHAVGLGIEPREYRPVNVLLRDDRERVVGGLIGATVWGWLEVKQLWVSDDHRGQGHGTRLLQMAEQEARRRGCHHALLDTFDFQAREFYEALGYRAFGGLVDFPRGHSRFFLQKTL